MVANCIKALKKSPTDITAVKACDCQADKLDWHFTNSQYKKNTSYYSVLNVEKMIKEDTALSRDLDACLKNSGQLTLLQADGFKKEFVENCMKSIQKSTVKKLDSVKLENFCICQLNLVRSKKVSDIEMKTLNNPNSLFFYEMMYKCGNPFTEEGSNASNWNQQMANNVIGPGADTIHILTLNGMTYVKVKTGSMVQFWLFDTGASDLLINTEMEQQLKEENILGNDNYLGTEVYEMANGTIDTCRRYSINNVRIGNYSVNNVQVAVTQKGKKIIVGKALLNKFRNWVLDNRDNTLILTK